MYNFAAQKLTAIYFTINAWRTVGFRGLHSIPKIEKMSSFSVHILPALQDNYMYLITDNNTNESAIVDPVDPDRVLAEVEKHAVRLTTVLTTHHHWDHAGGNEKLVSKYKGGKLVVVGGDDRIGALNKSVKHNDVFNVGNLKIRCLETPCHTTGHICYFVEASNGDSVVFTGDTLFLGGCGRFFEGTADQMYSALVEKLSSLPDSTKVYCGHEYSLQNLAFGHHVEPLNQDIVQKIKWATERREKNLPTVPSTILEEKQINPFMRVNQQSVQAHAGTDDGIATMAFIRKEKDTFKS